MYGIGLFRHNAVEVILPNIVKPLNNSKYIYINCSVVCFILLVKLQVNLDTSHRDLKLVIKLYQNIVPLFLASSLIP